MTALEYEVNQSWGQHQATAEALQELYEHKQKAEEFIAAQKRLRRHIFTALTWLWNTIGPIIGKGLITVLMFALSFLIAAMGWEKVDKSIAFFQRGSQFLEQLQK